MCLLRVFNVVLFHAYNMFVYFLLFNNFLSSIFHSTFRSLRKFDFEEIQSFFSNFTLSTQSAKIPTWPVSVMTEVTYVV